MILWCKQHKLWSSPVFLYLRFESERTSSYLGEPSEAVGLMPLSCLSGYTLNSHSHHPSVPVFNSASGSFSQRVDLSVIWLDSKSFSVQFNTKDQIWRGGGGVDPTCAPCALLFWFISRLTAERQGYGLTLLKTSLRLRAQTHFALELVWHPSGFTDLQTCLIGLRAAQRTSSVRVRAFTWVCSVPLTKSNESADRLVWCRHL